MAVTFRNGGFFWALALSAGASDLRVDLSSKIGQMEHSAAGILHSLATDDTFVVPLSLRMFRGNADEIAVNDARLRKLGIKQVQVVVSDTHGYDAPWPGDNGSYAKWEQVIDEVAAKVAGVEGVAFDLWNEPNGGLAPQMQGFWKRSKQQFFHTWMHGFRRLRSSVPNAVVVGPSPNTIEGGLILGPWGEQWIRDFLTFAQKNDVMPDVVSWHELLPRILDGSHGYGLVDRAQKLRSWMHDNGISPRPFSINEYTAEDDNKSPGTTVGFLAAVERSGVDSAAHSCWNDDQSCGSNFTSNCWSGTLDGLLSCPRRMPRAAWWVYAAYGNMTGVKVNVHRDTNVADAVAVLDASTASILIGTYASRSRVFAVSVTGVPEGLQTASNVFVTVRRVFGTDWAELEQPEVVSAQQVPVTNGEVLLTLSASSEDAFIVDIVKPNSAVV